MEKSSCKQSFISCVVLTVDRKHKKYYSYLFATDIQFVNVVFFAKLMCIHIHVDYLLDGRKVVTGICDLMGFKVSRNLEARFRNKMKD